MNDEKTSVVIMALHEKNDWFFFALYSLTAHFFFQQLSCAELAVDYTLWKKWKIFNNIFFTFTTCACYKNFSHNVPK